MIIFITKTGEKQADLRAQEYKVVYQKALSRIRCRQCSKDTIIEFKTIGNSGRVYYEIKACCKDFQNKVDLKLKSL